MRNRAFKNMVFFGFAVVASVLLVVLWQHHDVGCREDMPVSVVSRQQIPTKAVATPGQIHAVQPLSIPSSEAIPDLTHVDLQRYPVLTEDFFKTSLAGRWRERGVTVADIKGAVDIIREQGGSESQLSDPSLIGQYLPERDVAPVYVDDIQLAQTATAGQPIPFTLKANYPDPSYSFEHWKISIEGAHITVRPIGSKVVGPAPAMVVPIELEGELPALEPGVYTVNVAAIGQAVQKTLVVK